MSEENSTPAINEDKVALIKKHLTTLWNGEIPLAKTFWLYYFVACFALAVLGNIIGIFKFVSILWAGFMVKPIFVSADKYEGEKLWALLGKVAAVLIALGLVLGALS